jgi:hypothetical protein
MGQNLCRNARSPVQIPGGDVSPDLGFVRDDGEIDEGAGLRGEGERQQVIDATGEIAAGPRRPRAHAGEKISGVAPGALRVHDQQVAVGDEARDRRQPPVREREAADQRRLDEDRRAGRQNIGVAGPLAQRLHGIDPGIGAARHKPPWGCRRLGLGRRRRECRRENGRGAARRPVNDQIDGLVCHVISCRNPGHTPAPR